MDSRVLLFSPRKIRNEVFRGFDYEFEDFVASVEDVDWYMPEFRHTSPGRRRLSEALTRRLFKWPINPAYKMPAIEKEYDIFFVQCMFIWDLQFIGRIPDWSGKVKKSVIYITELFVTNIAKDPQYMEVLKRFDLILTSYTGTLEALKSYTGVETRFCTPGIDALKGAPGPGRLNKPIELFSLGRGRKSIFPEFKKLVDEHGWTYLYNPIDITTIDDYRDNRTFLRDTLKRTLFLEVNPAKFDEEADTKDQHEIGYRYYEGIAAGCVLVGTENKNPQFKEIFPWEDCVLLLPEDRSNTVGFLLDLYADKERLERLSRANILGAHLHHDFYYRWAFTLDCCGFTTTEIMQNRYARLQSESARYQ